MSGPTEPLQSQLDALGVQRFEEFVTCHATLQAMTLCLVVSLTSGRGCDYSDECLEAIAHDADDMLIAARSFQTWAHELAHAWRQERIDKSLLWAGRAR